MVFSEVVSFVGTSLALKDMELFLADMIADPIKMHVDCLGSFLFDGVALGDTRSSAIVSLDGSGRLPMTQFFKSCAKGTGLLAIVE